MSSARILQLSLSEKEKTWKKEKNLLVQATDQILTQSGLLARKAVNSPAFGGWQPKHCFFLSSTKNIKSPASWKYIQYVYKIQNCTYIPY